MDYAGLILNKGLYQLRIVSGVPDWETNDGEMVLYSDGTNRALYIYISDGWYKINFSTSTFFIDRLMPIGTIIAWGGDDETAASLPAGMIVCNGASAVRTDYQELFDVIGTSFGAGDDAPNTFAMPDLRGRFPLGKDNMGSSGAGANRETEAAADTIGGVGGNEAQHDSGQWNTPAAPGNNPNATTGGSYNMPPYQTVAYLIQA